MKKTKHLTLLFLLMSFTFVLNAQETKIGFEIGDLAPEIELPNPDGDTVLLSSLRGEVVLLDFWAGWCGPCRRENPVVVETYNNYKDKRFTIGKGFNVYGVSLDKNEKTWLDAIEKDNLTWSQVSDLLYWQSPYVRLYNVRGIPANFLLDENGVIIAKNLRGERLANTLDKYVMKDPLTELFRLTKEYTELIEILKEHDDYAKYDKEIRKIEKQLEKLIEEIKALKSQTD
ncbi:MAG: redoxin domain-containing protein [Bacteroidales bacterium]|jgi:thiol-disulfide isomerase/thioredoxin|nr:redoxin domain-containing protein [Bacteroidales bacterium]